MCIEMVVFVFFKQKTAYEMRISDWSSDVCSSDLKHFVVIKGVRGDRVLTGDSVLGLNEYSLEDFEKHWNGIALAIVEGGKKRPEFNLAGDWGPWSQAPLEKDGSLHVSAGDLTTQDRKSTRLNSSH